MKKFFIVLLTGLISLAAVEAGEHSTKNISTAIVDFRECINSSKLGKHQQEAFGELRQKTIEALEKSERELQEMSSQLNDIDYLDTLSKEAEIDLQNNFRQLNEKFSQEQNQYYQMLNQANYKFVQDTQEKVQQAAKEVAKEKNIQLIINEETCFYYDKELDITKEVIAKMDEKFKNNDV